MDDYIEAIRASKERFEELTNEPLGNSRYWEKTIRELFEHLETLAIKLNHLESK